MGQSKESIMRMFYEEPSQSFTVRQISRSTKIPKSTVHKYLVELKKEGLITKNNTSTDGLFFKIKKTNYFIEEIVKSGLIDYLIENLNPSGIVLFGSIRKGESNRESDIDLFIETSIKKELNLKQYERKLKHKIQLFIESSISKLQPNLLNNVVNGIKLYGVIKLNEK
ncbi:MAG: nucleotidyltransferase domain-containing protein [Candidatus Pacearchaeota archaeon]|jgi:predicted nucleotidyltransferase